MDTSIDGGNIYLPDGTKPLPPAVLDWSAINLLGTQLHGSSVESDDLMQKRNIHIVNVLKLLLFLHSTTEIILVGRHEGVGLLISCCGIHIAQLVQVTTVCLTSPSHHHNQFWLNSIHRSPILRAMLKNPMTKMYLKIHIRNYIRAESRFAPSQGEMTLLCNDVSHWLGARISSIYPQGCI